MAEAVGRFVRVHRHIKHVRRVRDGQRNRQRRQDGRHALLLTTTNVVRNVSQKFTTQTGGHQTKTKLAFVAVPKGRSPKTGSSKAKFTHSGPCDFFFFFLGASSSESLFFSPFFLFFSVLSPAQRHRKQSRQKWLCSDAEWTDSCEK